MCNLRWEGLHINYSVNARFVSMRRMPPKRTTPTKPAPKRTTPTKPAATKPPSSKVTAAGRSSAATRGGTTAARGRGAGVKQPAAGVGKKAAPASKGKVPATSKPIAAKKVWTEQDTMARRIQNAYRVYRCKKKLLALKKKKEDFDTLMETLQREVSNCSCESITCMRKYLVSRVIHIIYSHNRHTCS